MNNRLLVATRKGLFIFERDAQSDIWTIFTTAFIGDPVSAVLSDPRSGVLYCALNLGHFGVKLHRSDDAGLSWRECATPVYPHQEEPADKPWKLTLLWCLETGGSDEPGVLWAGTIPGGLFRSADAGASWDLVRPLWDRPERQSWFGGGYDEPGIHSICVDPRDSAHVTVGVSCAGVWVTLDGGASWDIRATGMRAAFMPPERAFDPHIQDPHRVTQCPAAPDVLWAQHHNGIFRSTDASDSWQEITDVYPSVFGFAVAVHPHDPDTAWFVPAVKDECRVPVDGRLVVTRTRDGGRSFESLYNGLPHTPAYDLVYRHGLDVDASGMCLAMGSTTGSLWSSADQGDSWQAISTHLPPIYATRFS